MRSLDRRSQSYRLLLIIQIQKQWKTLMEGEMIFASLALAYSMNLRVELKAKWKSMMTLMSIKDLNRKKVSNWRRFKIEGVKKWVLMILRVINLADSAPMSLIKMCLNQQVSKQTITTQSTYNNVLLENTSKKYLK